MMHIAGGTSASATRTPHIVRGDRKSHQRSEKREQIGKASAVSRAQKDRSESLLEAIDSSHQSRICAASDYFTTWQKVRPIFRVSSHTEAPAQGLRMRCALILVAKKKKTPKKNMFSAPLKGALPLSCMRE